MNVPNPIMRPANERANVISAKLGNGMILTLRLNSPDVRTTRAFVTVMYWMNQERAATISRATRNPASIHATSSGVLALGAITVTASAARTAPTAAAAVESSKAQ